MQPTRMQHRLRQGTLIPEWEEKKRIAAAQPPKSVAQTTPLAGSSPPVSPVNSMSPVRVTEIPVSSESTATSLTATVPTQPIPVPAIPQTPPVMSTGRMVEVELTPFTKSS
jgi:hypothetical protein